MSDISLAISAAPGVPPPAMPDAVAAQPLAVFTPPTGVPAPFQTPLRLTPEQADRYDRENLLRIQELRREMGLTPLNDVIQGGWMWARRCHEQYYQGDLSWRLAFGTIFGKSNFTLGSGIRHVRYNTARVQDDLLGTTPFFAALARVPGKEALVKQVEEYVQTEIEVSAVRQNLREAQKIALYRNECVVKTGYISDTTPFVGEATVLVDNATGQPITTPDKGLFIHEDDDTIPSEEVEGMVMLGTDPSFVMADFPVPGMVLIPASGDQPERVGRWQFFPELEQTMTHREGVYAEPLDYRSFLCPLKVRSIHEADCVVHLYLETPKRIAQIYGGIDVSQEYFTWWANPGQDKPKYEQGELNTPPTVIHQQVIIAEVYRRCDPDGTGREKETFAVIDLTNEKTIYRNYLANHMAKRPFEVIPGVERIPGRWYGRGIYGMLENHLLYEDAELNRANFKNSKDATITMAYRDACDSWKNGQPPVIGSDETYWLNPNWNSDGNKVPIQRINLYEKVETDLEMMNIMRQSGDSLVGAISTQSANQSGFDQSGTATGNQLVQQASDVITKATEQDQIEGLNAILAQLVATILENMDRKKLVADPRTGLLSTLNRNECRRMARDVRLLLTRSRSTQLLTTSQAAVALFKDYRQMMLADPAGARIGRDEYINQAKALEVQNADALFPEISDEMIAQWQQQQANAQQPPNQSISIGLKDLVGTERDQALAKFGIQAASPEQLAMHAAQEAELKAASRPEPTNKPPQ